MGLLKFVLYGTASVDFGWCAYLAAFGRLDEVPAFIVATGLALVSLNLLIDALEAGFPCLKDQTNPPTKAE